MKFIQDPFAANAVRRVEPGSIVIGKQHYTGNICLLSDRVISDWPDREIAELSVDYLAPVLEQAPEILLLGSGWQKPCFAPRELVFALARRGIGLDVMDTSAACRTFNILLQEGRLPAAVLYMDN